MAKTVLIPFYATVFRADGFAEALEEIAPLSLRYGASEYFVFRSGDDGYRFHCYFGFESKAQFETFWYGPEFIEWRERYSSWYQIPLVYDFGTVITRGRSEVAQAAVEYGSS
jgi:hypothetical protein